MTTLGTEFTDRCRRVAVVGRQGCNMTPLNYVTDKDEILGHEPKFRAFSITTFLTGGKEKQFHRFLSDVSTELLDMNCLISVALSICFPVERWLL